MTEDQSARIRIAQEEIFDLRKKFGDANSKDGIPGMFSNRENAMAASMARSALLVAEQRLKNLIRQIAKED